MQSKRRVLLTIKRICPLVSNPKVSSDRSHKRSLKFIARALFNRLQKLVSRQRDPDDYHSARKLRLILFKYSSGRVKKIASKKVPLITFREERGFINTWHEVTYRAILAKILIVYRKFEWRHRFRSRYIGLKASDFIKMHLCESYPVIEPRFVNERLTILGKKYNIYRPMEEGVKRKICGYRDEEPESSSLIKEMVLHHTTNYKKLRQTKIDEYFTAAKCKRRKSEEDNFNEKEILTSNKTKGSRKT